MFEQAEHQIYACDGGRDDPHYGLSPWKVEKFLDDCKKHGLMVVYIKRTESYNAKPEEREKDDWFLSVWNCGTEEWDDEIDQLYNGLKFTEQADLFLTKEYQKLVVGGRGVAGVSGGTTAQSYVGRDEKSNVNLPSFTKYTPDLAGFFPGMSALAEHLGFSSRDSVDSDHPVLFWDPIHQKNILDNLTLAQMLIGTHLLLCHCDRFNSIPRGGILTASNVYLEHDQSAFDKAHGWVFNLKRDTQIALQQEGL